MAYKSLKKRRQYLKDWKLKNTEKVKKSSKKYYLKNKKKILKKQREYFKANPLIKAETNKRYRKKYPEKIREQNKKKYYDSISTPLKKKIKLKKRRIYEAKQRKNNIQFKLRQNLSRRIREQLQINSTKKTKKTEDLIGCKLSYLKKYLEKNFLKGMNWDNYNINGWHIDHIKPCSNFDLSNVREQKICFNYKNLQPLWAKDNIRKSNR